MGSLRHTTRRIAAALCPAQKTQTPTPTPAPSPTPKPVITFQRYLNRAYQTAKAAHELGPTDLGLRASIPISIYLRSKGTVHEYAGVFDEIGGVGVHLDIQEYFSGSLPKVAAMFAAYKLRKEAQLLIKDIQDGKETATAANFFTKLKPRLHLSDQVDLIKNDRQVRDGRTIAKEPSFAQILAVTGSFATPATLDVNFTADFRAEMRRMVIVSNNCSAGECIFRLSYPYINVALMQDGYFSKPSMKGIWLCGDYIIPSCPNQNKKQPFIRIDTINDCNEVATPRDCGSAQNTTSKEMAKFFLDILTKQMVDPVSSDEMRAMLREGQHGSPPGTPAPAFPPRATPFAGGGRMGDASYLTRDADDITIPLLFDVDGVKIGQGPLKPDPARSPEVRSEGLLIKWKKIDATKPDFDATLKKKFDDLNLTGEAAVCYQNFSSAGGQLHDGIVKIIHSSVLDYINQAPLP